MAESPEDKDVDALIADMRATLNKLEAAQHKDVKDEDAEETGESKAKNLKGAEQDAFARVRANREKDRFSVGNSENPDDQADNKAAAKAMPKAVTHGKQVEDAARKRGNG